MEIELPLLSIKIEPVGGSGYKSIGHLSWNDIPGLAVLTGRNGSGKTQLLELLSYSLVGARLPGVAARRPAPVKISLVGDRYDPDEIGFIPSGGRFSGGGAMLAKIPAIRQNILKHGDSFEQHRGDLVQLAKAYKISKAFAGLNWKSFPPSELSKIFPDIFSVLLADPDVTSNLSIIFFSHRLKMIEAQERGTPGKAPDGRDLGPAPWDVVNESLAAASFRYQVVSPLKTGLMEAYELRFVDTITGIVLGPNDLSSGEKVLLQQTLWLYSSTFSGVFPRLLLLDEPDAHLHPSMTHQFLSVVSDVLVKRYGVRVIMTTHSPSTVALAPEGSVFQLDRDADEVIKVHDRAISIGSLTAGLITVSKATKFCFVEDEDDIAFYEAVRDVLIEEGRAGSDWTLPSSPSLVFIAASVGRGREKVPGGLSIVKKWVEKLDAKPLNQAFRGIIDRDVANRGDHRIKVIGRYSFENYLLDPINLFALLIEVGSAPIIEGLKISQGSEHRLRASSMIDLQKITDAVALDMELAEPALRTPSRTDVTYTGGARVSVPNWVIDFRGRDLLSVAQKAWPNGKQITPPRLISSLRRVRLVPSELAALLAELQRS